MSRSPIVELVVMVPVKVQVLRQDDTYMVNAQNYPPSALAEGENLGDAIVNLQDSLHRYWRDQGVTASWQTARQQLEQEADLD